MKLKKGSVKTLFLVFLWQAAYCPSNAAVAKSMKIVDVFEDNGEQDASFKSKWTKKKRLRDSFLPKDISRLTTFFAERNATFSENQTNACSLSDEVLAQIFKFSARAWLVDDNAVGLLHNDLQSLVECTQPRERVVFANKQTIRLARTLEIVHKLEFIGKPLGSNESSHAKEMVPSLTCPYSKPTILVRAVRFTATTLNITGCESSSVSSSAAIVLEQGSSATLNRLILKDNRNRAIYVKQGAHLTLSKSHLINNNVSGDGGAIYVKSGSTVHIQKSDFKRNSATHYYGGAICFQYNNVVVIKDSTFEENTCVYNGGAICLFKGNALRIQKCVFANNTSTSNGGVLFIEGTNEVDVEDTTFTNNTSGASGGVIHAISSSTISIIKSTFADNKAKYYGGVLAFGNQIELSVKGSSFTNNTSVEYGGGALCVWSYNVLDIHESSFTNNTSKAGAGGAIYVYDHNLVNIKGSMFANNTCGYVGGMMYLFLQNTLMMQESMISNNLAKNNGGSMYCDQITTMIVHNSTLIGNNAMKNGGALFLGHRNRVIFVDSTLSRNKATNGSVSSLGTSNVLSIQRSTLSDNVCSSHGSVLYLGSDNDVLGFNSNITNNQAGQTSGKYNGAIYSDGTSNSVAFVKSIISGNWKSNKGAIHLHTSKKETSTNSRKGIMV